MLTRIVNDKVFHFNQNPFERVVEGLNHFLGLRRPIERSDFFFYDPSGGHRCDRIIWS